MKQLFPFALIIISLNCFSQTINIQNTGKLKTRTAADMTFFKDNLFSVESSIKGRIGFSAKLDKAKQSIKIKSFSKNGTAITEKELAGGESLFGPVEPSFKILNDSLYILYSRYTADEKINICATGLNASTLETTEEHIVLSFPQKNININIFGTSFLFYSFISATSPDGSKTVFFWCNGDNTDFHYSVIDKNFTAIRNGNGTVPGLKKMMVENLFIDNDGSFYAGVTFKYYDGGAVIVCNKEETAIVVPLALGNSNAHSVYVSGKIENEKLNVAGLVSTNNLITGVYQGTIDIKNKLADKLAVTNLPEAIIEKANKDDYGYARTKKYGLYPDIQMQGYTLPDGTIITACELHRYASTASGPSAVVKGPLLLSILKENSNPVIEYIARKETKYGELNKNSFYGFVYRGNLLLLYTAAVANMQRSMAEAETFSDRNSAKTAIAVMKINANGIIENKVAADGYRGFYIDYQKLIPVNATHLFQGLNTRRFEYSDYKSEQDLLMISIEE